VDAGELDLIHPQTGGTSSVVVRAEPRAGQILSGRYRIVRELGRGGMGAVYEAVSIKLGRRFAIKFPRGDRAENQEMLHRFKREVAVGARLESSHIARFIDLDTLEDGTPFVVMEYVPGEDLRRLLAHTGAMPLRRVVNLIVQACRGLAVAHRQGIIHRDLKPSNLAVTPELGGYEHLTILDFGAAKTARMSLGEGESTRTGAVIGTLAYMPPEQIRGEKDLDARADIYSLGAILYECLTAQRAFDAQSNHALMYRILHERPAPLAELRPDLPGAVSTVVERALSPNRADRFQDVEELATALESLIVAPLPFDSDPTSREVTFAGRNVKRRAFRDWLSVAAFFGIGLVAGALILLRTHWRSASSDDAPAKHQAPSVASAPAPARQVGVELPSPRATTSPPPVAEPRSDSALAAAHADVSAPSPVARTNVEGSAGSRRVSPRRETANGAGVSARPAPQEAVTTRSRDETASNPVAPDPLERRGYVVHSPYGATP
jgi:serine/threonine-protein kinase